jgi:hypothetical protein
VPTRPWQDHRVSIGDHGMPNQEPRDSASLSSSEDPPPSIRYASWSSRIQMASDLDRLSDIVRDYFAGWRYEELRLLPPELTALAVAAAADLAGSAVIATRLELKVEGDTGSARLFREVALTLRAAASRFHFLTALRVREAGSLVTTGEPGS